VRVKRWYNLGLQLDIDHYDLQTIEKTTHKIMQVGDTLSGQIVHSPHFVLTEIMTPSESTFIADHFYLFN